ncbi:uncharacterized protein PRCAT00006022001 [Priceomyces carsonii]|uniref:uncharacterized protein n=1 Tax=Priceomyces carsonii TaxID=28549 RepID=UPI002ED7A06C|nr:unnamed protein product [Priceomyces carsonii]
MNKAKNRTYDQLSSIRFLMKQSRMAERDLKGTKRASSPVENVSGDLKLRDENGFRMKRQVVDKAKLKAFEQLGGEMATDKDLPRHKTIQEEESEGASYTIDGALRRVNPYYFTYLTYCKMRWRDRKLLDIFVDEFRDRDAKFYKEAMSSGKVTINKKPAGTDTIVKNGDLISHRCHRHEPAVSSRDIKIVFEDENLLVIDKPSGIPVHPTGRYRYNTITKILQHEMGITVHPCNRLDRLTSGLMFLGKNSKGADSFVQQIKDGTVRKLYVARVVGKFPSDSEVIVDKPVVTISPKLGLNRVDMANGKNAVTIFKRITYDLKTNTSIVKCFPKTGRTHQIRVHLQHLGYPIANDPIYSNAFVWGKDLGKDYEGDYTDIMERLDRIGKDKASSTWFHPQEDGEILSGKTCEQCDVDLYTDPTPNDLDLWLHALKYEAADKSWSYQTQYPDWALEVMKPRMELAIKEARKCGETQTQFNVGAVLVYDGVTLETGHSRELPGNTHAEQCALEKYYKKTNSDVPMGCEIYTTMEPCTLRLSGNLPCTDRILKTDITTCFVGVLEPDVFVKNNSSLKKLTDNGVEYIHIPGYENECLEIAEKGHEKR